MHTLQPQHKRLTQEETEKLLDNYNIGLAQLPKIALGDVSLSEDCKKGDVIEIKRGEELYYRIVV